MPAPRIEHPIHPDLVTRETAASMIGVSLPTIRHYCDIGTLHEYRIAPRVIRLDSVEVRQFADARNGK